MAKKRPPVKLTTQQKDCITYPSDQPLLIRGIPGSGKTTVLLERALRLASEEPADAEQKVVMLTYNNLLSKYILELAVEAGAHNTQATTFHGWGLHLLECLGLHSRGGVVTDGADGKERTELVKFALNTVGKYQAKLTPAPIENFWAKVKFLGDEFEWIKGLGKDKDRYMNEPRTGRNTGVQIQKRHREWVWAVYEKYNEMLSNKGRFDFDDVALLLDRNLNRLPHSVRPVHILVDEAQDLTAMQLKVVGRLPLSSLTIAADKGQSIYHRNFSWAAVGINIRGRSRSLERTFRSTKQVIKLANSLQRHDPLVVKRDEEFVPAAEPKSEGPKPELYMSPTLKAQVGQVAKWVAARRRSFPDDTIGVIVPRRDMMEGYTEALREVGINPQILTMETAAEVSSPGVKLVTFHSAKGLEFDHVAVTSLRDGTVPSRPPQDASDEDIQEHLATERRKVYVAMTRARLDLALFGVGPNYVSPFIEEMDASLYTRVG
ncbi:MAG: UvrD-helicase domain-containing protein [Symbiobacteriia bacterium]